MTCCLCAYSVHLGAAVAVQCRSPAASFHLFAWFPGPWCSVAVLFLSFWLCFNVCSSVCPPWWVFTLLPSWWRVPSLCMLSTVLYPGGVLVALCFLWATECSSPWVQLIGCIPQGAACGSLCEGGLFLLWSCEVWRFGLWIVFCGWCGDCCFPCTC